MEIKGVDNMAAFARDFLRGATEQSPEHAVVVGLYGNLGAGKTTFAQCVAREFGITERVTSPTFVVRKSYDIISHPRFSRMVHIDAYRLNKPEDLVVLNWEEDVKDKKAIIFIEWADRIADALPESAIKLSFTVVDEETRDISYGKA